MRTAGRLPVLYGSQTFTAQEVAEKIWRTTKALGLRGPVQAMDDYPISELIHEDFVLFVCATTGQGDEPDNMKKFWKFLLRRSLPSNSLVRLKFAVLGLGDSSYAKFNFVSKKLHKRLLQLGATPLVDVGLCDYQHDLGHDAVMIPWLKDYYSKLKTYLPDIPNDNLNSKFIPRWKVTLLRDELNGICGNGGEAKDIYFRDGRKNNFCEPLQLEVGSNVRTTDPSHFQDVRLISLKATDGVQLNYKPGDVYNIRPRNSEEDIGDLFEIFQQHKIDIKPHYRLLVEEYHEGPERAAQIGGFSGGANTVSSQDDEYRYAGVEDPKVMITTSREPSARLKMFVKELRLIFPNSQRMNRGGYEMSQLIHACRANQVTDFIVVHEHRGVPDNLVICHLPYGPTASFTLSGVVMRHDIPDIGPMSEQYPHLVFHNFKTELGTRTMNVLKYLFPVPKPSSKRVVTFANNDDYISFRQHTYRKAGKDIELTEIGPRFQMRLYEIKLGTLESLDAADTEWALRPYMNTAAKRRFLSQEDGWQEDLEAYMSVPEFLRTPLTMQEIAEQYWDLKFIPTQYVFSLLALVSQDKLERDKCTELSSPEGQEDWLNYCRRPRRTILEVLHDFHKSTSKLTIEILFELFSSIKPRSFSIASSALHANGRAMDLLVAVVKFYSKLKKPRLGLGSNWLAGLKQGDRMYGWIKSGTFKFPDESTPLILIGPGTGLAPFRSLIQERIAQGSDGANRLVLFFGCRYRDRDYHCGEELEGYKQEGRITLLCAFSRDQEDKIYVQHKISQHRDFLWPLLRDGKAHIYISGSAKNMPENVKSAFAEDVLCKEGGATEEEAKALVKQMESSGQLQTETW